MTVSQLSRVTESSVSSRDTETGNGGERNVSNSDAVTRSGDDRGAAYTSVPDDDDEISMEELARQIKEGHCVSYDINSIFH